MLPRVLEPEAMDSPDEALAYDAMDHRAVNQRFVDDLLALHPGARRVLDLGAGTALIPIALCARRAGVTVTAVDLAPSMLRRGAENVARAGLTARVALLVADASALPFAPADHDAVCSNSLAHHVPDPIAFFGAVARLAGDAAAVFVRDLHRPSTQAELDALVALYGGDEPTLARALFRASLHAALTVDEVRAASDAAGLRGATIAMTSDRHWTLSRAAR